MSALEAEALTLWRAWFKESGGDPWIWDSFNSEKRCFFRCIGIHPDHDPDCIFEHARRMIADAERGAPVTETFTLLDSKTVRVVQYQDGATIALDMPIKALLEFAFKLPISSLEPSQLPSSLDKAMSDLKALQEYEDWL